MIVHRSLSGRDSSSDPPSPSGCSCSPAPARARLPGRFLRPSSRRTTRRLGKGPPTGYTPTFPPPEVPDNVQKVAGRTPAEAVARGTTAVTAWTARWAICR